MAGGSPPRLNHLVWASLACSVAVGLLVHLLATFLPVGWTPPLLVGFYLVFFLFWTLPVSALLGMILGALLRLTVRRLGPRDDALFPRLKIGNERHCLAIGARREQLFENLALQWMGST